MSGVRCSGQDAAGEVGRAVVLLSGGMDSATLLWYVKKELRVPEIHALSFAYGQRHARELEMARWQARTAGVAVHREVDISWFGELLAGASVLTDASRTVPSLDELSAEERRQPATYVPNRNMIFLSIAAAYAEARGMTDIFYGAQAQDEYGYWDCTVDFIEGINHLLGLNRGRAVTVHAPFAGKSKAQVLELGIELGVDYEHTWTCYRGDAEACGSCPSCVERQRAFEELEGRGQ